MIASERKYFALRESSEDFLSNPHYTSHLLNSENYSPSNYRTLIKPGVRREWERHAPMTFLQQEK